MDGIVHVAAQIVNQVLADNTHQVVSNHTHIVFRGIIANVGVNRRKTLRNRAASFQGSLVHQQNTLVVGHPFFNLKSSAAGSHTAANDQDINFSFFYFRVPYSLKFTQRFIR